MDLQNSPETEDALSMVRRELSVVLGKSDLDRLMQRLDDLIDYKIGDALHALNNRIEESIGVREFRAKLKE